MGNAFQKKSPKTPREEIQKALKIMVFQNNFNIETFSQGLDFPPLELYNTVDESCMILNPLGEWNPAKGEVGFTHKEELLKLDDKIFDEAEKLTSKLKLARNRYINEAVSIYNLYNTRRLLKNN